MAEQFELPLAMVLGEEIRQLPQDLYIPPQALRILLESFEGPLDLLLYLVRKNKFDIRNLPVADIAQQYSQFVQLMQELDLELAGEYLWMSAFLTELKSKLLLPTPQLAEEEEDPRAELQDLLLQYQQYQQAGQWLNSLPLKGRDRLDAFIAIAQPTQNPAQVQLQDLLEAFEQFLQRQVQNHPHQVEAIEALEIEDKTPWLLNQLQQAPQQLRQLCQPQEGRLGIVVVFLSLLNLIRDGHISFRLDTPDPTFYLKVPNTP